MHTYNDTEKTTEELKNKVQWLEEALKDYVEGNNTDDKLITANVQLRYEIEALKKELDDIKAISKELLECSLPSNDPLKETRYICASCFLTPILNKV